ncbi:G-protein coupled receptor daf-37-like [Physella acuta]|uniref:G-protein coupled receptor daf-37-like n=1 Tax=Physella acuta TaxID=109671 RepID=UPI0027DBFB84|nr:G-protein coupled receptor daf-37-like [Physella acuta]XP_059165576.1 G-protein coupled receptor daf-37-like [Physella acuta]
MMANGVSRYETTTFAGASLLAGLGSNPGDPGEDVTPTGGRDVMTDSLLDVDYDEVGNMSSEAWFRYSCAKMEKPNGFLKSILEPTICCCGILGITLTMIVLSRKTMCTSTNCYLTALAVADLLFLLILSSRILVEMLADCHFYQGSENAIFIEYSIIFMDIFQYLTVGVTVMLAIERYIAICHPMRAMNICTVKRARIIICVLTFVAFVLRSPKFFELRYSYTPLTNGETKLVVSWVYVYDDRAYTYIVTGVIMTILPLCTLMALNIRLILEIRRSSRYLQYHLGGDLRVRSVVSREELKITMMLVSVIIAFFVCHTPYMVYSFITALSSYDPKENPSMTNESSYKWFRNVCHSLLALKSSCNFILYCWFSEKFWATFKRTFCQQYCLPKQATNQINGYNYSHHYLHRPSCYITKETTC